MSEPDPTLPSHIRLRARGTASNAAGRFERETRERFDDGWDLTEEERLLRTEVREEVPRSALTYNRSPDLPFDRSVNPYRGCEHGCVYCFARPSHAFLGLSPGLDFETRLIARPGIADVLARELRAKSYQPGVIALGTNTDPYQPVEARYGLMRQILQVLCDHHHPVAVTTKGTLVERDIDLLSVMAARVQAGVGVSLTTLDPDLARRMEPRCPSPARRLQTIRRLADAGIPVRVMISPLVPGLSDHEAEAILEAAYEAGARRATCIPLRLPREVSGLFQAWLSHHYPDRAAHVMNRVREMHGGRDYDPDFGRRMRGQGLWADLLKARINVALTRLGYDRSPIPLSLEGFRLPSRPGDQLSLF